MVDAIFAEGSVSATFPSLDQEPPVEIALSLRLEIPGEVGVSTVIGLEYEPKLPDTIQDTLHQCLYDGAHSGLAVGSGPWPENGVRVIITSLRISPASNASGDLLGLSRISRLLQLVTSQAVLTIWEGLKLSR